MNLKPHLNRILAERISNDHKTKSGIEFNSKQEFEKAKVIEVSNDLKNNNDIKVGTTIYFEPHLVVNLTYDNKDLILINYEDILSYIEND